MALAAQSRVVYSHSPHFHYSVLAARPGAHIRGNSAITLLNQNSDVTVVTSGDCSSAPDPAQHG